MTTPSNPPLSILRASHVTCSSASCRATNSVKRVSFAGDLTSTPPRRSTPSPPSTIPSNIAPPRRSSKRHTRPHHHSHNNSNNRQKTAGSDHNRARHHSRHNQDDNARRHRHHHHCKKRRSRSREVRQESNRRPSVLEQSELSLKKQRKRDAGVNKVRTAAGKRRNVSSTVPSEEVMGSSVTSVATSRVENRPTCSVTPACPANALTVWNGQNRNTLNAHMPVQAASQSRFSNRGTSKERLPEMNGKEDACSHLEKCKSSNENIMKCTRRSIARSLQLTREGLSGSVLKSVDARTLYELYIKINGKGANSEANKLLKKRLEAQEQMDGRRRGSTKQRTALAKLVANELGHDPDRMVNMPRRKLVQNYVVDAAAARMVRLATNQGSNNACRRWNG